MDYYFITPKDTVSAEETTEIVNFLHHHLEAYGDEPEAIRKCISFALDGEKTFGGFLVVAKKDGKIAGAVVVNKTGMQGYIPENILVYIAVDKNLRGMGLGKTLMQKTIEKASGSIKLHVEPDNPARYLYEKLGFTSKYLEMRLIRD